MLVIPFLIQVSTWFAAVEARSPPRCIQAVERCVWFIAIFILEPAELTSPSILIVPAFISRSFPRCEPPAITTICVLFVMLRTELCLGHAKVFSLLVCLRELLCGHSLHCVIDVCSFSIFHSAAALPAGVPDTTSMDLLILSLFCSSQVIKSLCVSAP